MNLVLPQIKFIEVPRLMSVSYTATLPVRDQTVLYVSSLLDAERVRRGTRKGSRVLTPFKLVAEGSGAPIAAEAADSRRTR